MIGVFTPEYLGAFKNIFHKSNIRKTCIVLEQTYMDVLHNVEMYFIIFVEKDRSKQSPFEWRTVKDAAAI